MAVCSQCGAPLGVEDRACPQCGLSLVGDAAQRLDAVQAPVAVSAGAMARNGAHPADSIPGGFVVSAAPTVARLILRRIEEHDRGALTLGEFEMDGRSVAVGRSPSCDIVLEGDQLVSRRHALFRFDGTHYTVVDLGSSNGTYVNDIEVRETTPLAEGDRIGVGEHELLFTLGTVSQGLGEQPSGSWRSGDRHPVNEAAAAAFTAHEIPAVELPRPARDAEPVEPPQRAADASGIDSIQQQLAQLVAASEALAHRAERQEHRAEQYRAALLEVRDRLDAVLGRPEAAPKAEPGYSRAELVRVARQAAEHPRHLDYLASLAECANALADALEQPSTLGAESALFDDLRALRSRLAELL